MVYILLFSISILWGSTFILGKILMEVFPVSFIVSVRFLIALALFTMIFRKKIRMNMRIFRNGTIIGLINGIALIVQMIGLKYTTASNSAFLTSTFIVFIPFIEYFVYRKKPSANILSGIGVSLVGVYLLSFTNLAAGFGGINKGDLITLVCGFLYGLQIFFISHFTKEENIFGLVFLQFGVSALTGIVWLAWEMAVGGSSVVPWHMMGDNTVLIQILGLSVFATFIPFSLQFYVQNKLSSVVAGVGYLTEPVFALVLAMIFLGETLSLQSWVGTFVILIGVLLVTLKSGKKLETCEQGGT